MGTIDHLELEMAQTLAEMALLSYGKTQSFDSSGGKSESQDARPQGEAHPLAEKWHANWVEDPIRETLEAARAELQAWRVRQALAEGDDSGLEDWVIEDGEGYAPAQVATKFKIAETRVRRIRLKRGRESEFGLSTDLPAVRVAGADERARNLYSQGCTLNQIAMQTGLHKTQVRRILVRFRTAA
jgi:hypothetical protein